MPQRQYQDVEPLFLKTRLCKFHSVGVCSRGSACSFAHGAKELSPLPDLSCTQMCPNLIKNGHCSDAACNFAHNKKELRPRPAKSTAPTNWADPPLAAAEEPAEEIQDHLGGEQTFTTMSSQSPMYQPWHQLDGSGMMFTFMPMSPMMVAGVPFGADSMWLDTDCESDVYCPSDVSDWSPQNVEPCPAVEDTFGGEASGAQSKEMPPLHQEAQGGSDGSTCFSSDCSDGEGEWTVAVGVKNTFLEFGDLPTSDLRRVRSVPALERL